METVRHRIGAGQFFVMMFVSRVVVTIALNVTALGGGNLAESVFGCLLAAGLSFVIALPLWLLQKKAPGQNVPEAAGGLTGKLLAAVCLLYLVLVDGASLGLFHIFLLDTVNPDFSAGLAMAGLLLVALYGAYRGIETVARCAGCVLVFLLAGAALVFGTAALRFDPENLEPLFYNGASQTGHSTMLFLSRTSVFVDLAVLLPMVNGDKAKGFTAMAFGSAAFLSLVLVLLQGCLGRYALTQEYPGFTHSTLSRVHSLQRLDAVFVGVWLMGLAVKLACDAHACRVCLSLLFGERRPGLWLALTGAAVLGLSFAMTELRPVQRLLLNVPFLFVCTAATGFLLPLPALVKSRKKGGN